MSGERAKIEVREREQFGSRDTRRLRKQGLIPGVLYGKGKPPHAFVVAERDLRGALTGPSGLHAILDVVLAGQATVHPSILKEYQRDPIRGTVTHVDLQEVRLDQPIQALVAVALVGEAPGVKLGGVLTHVTRDVNVEALPMSIPEHVDLDVSALEIGDTLRVEDLPAVSGVTYLDDPHETVIVTVTLPKLVVEEEPEVVEGEEGEVAEGEAPAEGAEGESEGAETGPAET